MFSKTTTVKIITTTSGANNIHISSLRFIKVDKNDSAAVAKAETEFFPLNGGSHHLPRADAEGIYHQQHQLSFTIQQWHFYVEIRFDTGKHDPHYQSFGWGSGEGMDKITIYNMPLSEFLNTYKANASAQAISNIESLIAENNKALPEKEQERRSVFSRIFGC